MASGNIENEKTRAGPPETSLAAVFHQTGLVLQRFPLPQLSAGEVLVRVSCCTICGSDLHTIDGRRPVAGPTILGHEIIGRIVQLSGEVRDLDNRSLKIGDRISWSIAASCGNCHMCNSALPQKCSSLFKYGHHVADTRHALSGGMAEFCKLVNGSSILLVPEELSDAVACPANCATATVAAALRTAGHVQDATVLIHGAGMLGLTAAAMARHYGAEHVLISDVSTDRLERGKRFGSTMMLQADSTEVAAAVDRVSKGRGVDIIIDMSGSPEAIESSIELLRIGGRLILVGSVFPSRPIQLQAEQLVRKLIRIEGVHNYVPADLKRAFDFLAEVHTKYPFGELVQSTHSLANVNSAVKAARHGEVIRAAIVPESDPLVESD